MPHSDPAFDDNLGLYTPRQCVTRITYHSAWNGNFYSSTGCNFNGPRWVTRKMSSTTILDSWIFLFCNTRGSMAWNGAEKGGQEVICSTTVNRQMGQGDASGFKSILEDGHWSRQRLAGCPSHHKTQYNKSLLQKTLTRQLQDSWVTDEGGIISKTTVRMNET